RIRHSPNLRSEGADRKWPPTCGAGSAGRSSAPVIFLLRPCYCLFFSYCRLDFPLIFLALRLLPLFFSCCLQENRRGLHTLRLRHGHEFAQALLRWRSRFPFVWERAEERSGCPPLARAGAASRQQGPSAVDADARA